MKQEIFLKICKIIRNHTDLTSPAVEIFPLHRSYTINDPWKAWRQC